MGVPVPATAPLVVFAEPGPPAGDVRSPLPDLPGAVAATSMAESDSLPLQPGATLARRHGSALPAEAWANCLRLPSRGVHLPFRGAEPSSRFAQSGVVPATRWIADSRSGG